MIAGAAIQARAREWGLTEEVVEKDYVLGWLLWAIGSHPALSETWVFKGGTCLKKWSTRSNYRSRSPSAAMGAGRR